MFYVFFVLILLINAGAMGAVGWVLFKKKFAVEKQRRANLEQARRDYELRKNTLAEIGELSLGLVTQERYEELGQTITELEETVRAEQGRLTITEAEIEALDTRLRELEELKRELEVSNMDAVKELDMLRSQERDIKSKNEALRNQIQDSLEQLDLMMSALSSNAEAVERLTAARNELVEIEKQTVQYEEQISSMNSNYMTLKKAYDALDIEYAQLYEKQQAAGGDF